MTVNTSVETPPFGPIVNGTQIIFFEYRPSEPAGYAFMVLFALAVLAHLVYLFVLRAWFCIPMILGGIGELFGYYGRARASDNPNLVGPWIQQNMLIFVSPPFLAATVYMSLGRMITALDAKEHSLISPRWLTKIYVLVDIVCVITQLIGTALPASGDASAIALSKKILLAGLIFQVICLAFFEVIAWVAQRRIKNRGPPISGIVGKWQYYFLAVQVAILALIVRNLYRAIEFGTGEDGYVSKHEVFIYIFDAFLMLLSLHTIGGSLTRKDLPADGNLLFKTKPLEVENAVETALRKGYRHIDCAAIYRNEVEVGNRIKNSGVPREDIFITSKLWNTAHSPEDVEPALDQTLKDLGVGYLDLYLMHWPVAFKSGGKLFPLNSEGIFQLSDVGPATTYKAMEKLDPLVHKVAKEVSMDPGVLLGSWAIQRGTLSPPKSVTASRIARNLEVKYLPEYAFA
ncbi:hypothetical protein UA08_05739 [Talaromyces atroroseus]|uniref:D-xylose reductase [NAD(P)H] n=1 Tax=Talaromyces atroroseus TaxID=1441469 RepID=A0A225AV04_TALAT|nr:hypothetical protein UA08_05739 [Talaromyces atroroseus]OKL58806.1 hypothetical protein UA08_05739 [Talaromyces atroroseus]